MASCNRCGQDIRWVEVSVEDAGTTRVERIPLDSIEAMRPPRSDVTIYRLKSEDQSRAEPIHRDGIPGYRNHRETCPA